MYLLTGILIVFYIYGLIQWNKKVKWRLNPLVSKIIKYVHYVALLISLSTGILNLKLDLGFRGLWTTRIIIITVLITGIFFIFLSHKSILNRFEKIYFRVFSFFPLVVGGFFLIPFIGFVLIVSLFGQLISPAENIYYQDRNYRVQSTFLGVLGPPRLDIYEKKFIFEKHLKRLDYEVYGIDSINVSYTKDSTKVIVYGLYDSDEKQKDKTEIIAFKRTK
jgi:hypothetical protein